MISDKQKKAVSFGKEDGRLMLSVGAIRSGKTYAHILAFILYTQSLSKPYVHFILARRLRMLEVEMLPQIRAIARALGASYNYSGFNNMLTVGRQSYLLAAGNDDKSADLLLGFTIHSSLIDEATLLPKNYFNTAISRMSYEDSKGWVSCNPGSPAHYIKVDWLDKGKFDKSLEFDFEDNPTLGEKVKDSYRSMYSGVFKKRMIDGKWALADGLIYPSFTMERRNNSPENVIMTGIGIDYGTASTTAFVVLQRLKDRSLYIPEVVNIIGGHDKINKTDGEMASALMPLAEKYKARRVVPDPSAASLRAQLVHTPKRKFVLRKANNDVIPGIRTVGALLDTGDIVVAPGRGTEPLVAEFHNYSWDEKREDTPIKAFDHNCDGLRYVVMDMARNTFKNVIPLQRGL